MALFTVLQFLGFSLSSAFILIGLLFQYYKLCSRLKPPTYPFLGCLIGFYKNRRRLLDWYTDLLAESPAQTIIVSRLGATRTIVTADPENVEYILKTRFDNFPKGKTFTDILGDFLGRGIFNSDGSLWYAQRKAATASHRFSTRSLREYTATTLGKGVNQRLLPILDRASTENRVVDLQDLLRRLAFDSVCVVSLGRDPASLHPSFPASPLARSFDVASEISARRAAAPVFILWKIKRALGIGSEKVLREAIDHVHGSVTDLIRSRKAELIMEKTQKKDDLLSVLIEGGHEEEVIRDMVISFIMAGRDTTSAALTWFFWLVSRHPEIEKQVVKEAEAWTWNNLDSYDGLKEMKMLEACLCESMRLYPPVVWDSKHAVSDDALPDGTGVRRGDRVTYFPYGMGRMERLWGKDWAEFRPARWMGDEGGVAPSRVSPFKFPVFQAGPRVCLGKEMAFVQMKYVAASVLRRFEIRPCSSRQPVFVPLLTAYMAGGFKVTLRRRGE
ncbi:hypothetical protein H6P81_012285 [Aristolochia fimbriata]|uniref:Cytochrome P450 n=1 Tax=Aristolochia fimbriata TaxID=158543 RepID=A0AAV7EF23_ARIFI|nr:hypothetical protein H6P81_012285 [Aristolochia fimbriata]